MAKVYLGIWHVVCPRKIVTLLFPSTFLQGHSDHGASLTLSSIDEGCKGGGFNKGIHRPVTGTGILAAVMWH